MTCSCSAVSALIGTAAGCSGKMAQVAPYRWPSVRARSMYSPCSSPIAGELVSKQAIMQAVWPGIVVDEKNLAVQISALRRMLDDGQTERSCIQTEAGRGYRFVVPVTRLLADSEAVSRLVHAGRGRGCARGIKGRSRQCARARRASGSIVGNWQLLLALAVLTVVIGLGAAWFLRAPASIIDAAQDPTPSVSVIETPLPLPSPAPRLSIVVLPFQNLGGDAKDDYLADAITDDLTTDLSRIAGAFVVARESAYTYKGKATDVRQIGRELGVRYVAGRQRAPDRCHTAGQRSADLRGDRRASLVGSVRRRDQPTGRRAAADHRADVRHDRLQPGGYRERAQPARTADQPRRIRPHPAGTLDAATAARPRNGTRRHWRSTSARSCLIRSRLLPWPGLRIS